MKSAHTHSKSFALQSIRAKKGGLAITHLLDERFHVAEVVFQSSTTGGS
jgi:hypothetical protein